MIFDELPQTVLSRYADEHFLMLLCKYLDQEISSDESEELYRRLEQDERCRDLFAALLIQQQQLKESFDSMVFNTGSLGDISDTQIPNEFQQDVNNDQIQDLDLVLNLLAEDAVIAPALSISPKAPERELIQKVVYPPREKRKLTKFQVFSSIMSAAAILFLVLFIKLSPPQTNNIEIATLVDQVNAQWSDSGTAPMPGDRLWTNEKPLKLKKGIVNIRYDNGVGVLVEGPAIFEIERSGIFLNYGRLYSRVPSTGHGFTVHTPTSQFVDMGTEFGVQADINGASELHVTKGKVQLFAGSKGNSKVSQLITENKAVRYDVITGKIETVPIGTNSFVRSINSVSNLVWRGQTAFDLADVLGGGNGFGTGKLRCGVSLKSSLIEKIFPGEKIDKKRDFVQVESSLIDRYFTPYKGEDIQLSSEGDVFSGFPSNTRTNFRGAYYTKAFRKDYSYTLNHGGHSLEELTSTIRMHSNAGLTFSIENIRNSLPPDITVSRLTAECCMPSDALSPYNAAAMDNRKSESSYPKVDVFVLIDGEVRFQRRELIPDEGIVPIDIEIRPEDRTLTLVVTDSGTTTYDWLIFAKPRLELTTREPDSALVQ